MSVPWIYEGLLQSEEEGEKMGVVGVNRSPPSRCTLKQQMGACRKQLVHSPAAPPPLGALSRRPCARQPGGAFRTFSSVQCFLLLAAKKLGSLASSAATSPDVRLRYSFLPTLPVGAVFIYNRK